MAEGASGREEALSLLAGKAAFGAAFFDIAAQALVIGLGYRWGGIGLRRPGERVEILALYDFRKRLDPMAYSLIGTPCVSLYDAAAGTIDDNTHVFVRAGVCSRFESAALKALGAEAYRGEAFFDAGGAAAGHVFAMHDRPVIAGFHPADVVTAALRDLGAFPPDTDLQAVVDDLGLSVQSMSIVRG